MTIKPTAELSALQVRRLAERLEGRQRTSTRSLAIRAARIMEDEVIRIVDAEFDNNRPADRRKPGIKLINSFKGEAVQTERGWVARLSLKSGANAKKIAALEYGADPHTFGPSGVIVGGRGNPSISRAALSRRPSLAAFGVSDTQRLRFPDSRSGIEVAPLSVNHPGNKAYGMMRRAKERALRQIRGRA